GQFLHSLRQRRIEPLAEIDDLGLVGLGAGFGIRQEPVEGGDLPAQSGELLVEKLDLGERIGRDLLLRIELSAQARYRRAGAVACELKGETCRLRLLGIEIIAERREIELEFGLGRFLERQQLGELGDLRAQLPERAVLARDLAREEELRHDEHRKQKGDDKEE